MVLLSLRREEQGKVVLRYGRAKSFVEKSRVK